MNKKLKSKNGLITLVVSCACLLLTYFLYKYLKFDDVFAVILMTFALTVGVYGIFQIIRDTYN